MVVDKFTKMSHYAPTSKALNSVEFAKLLMKTVFKLHGVPEVIISDRGTLFTSDFWCTLTAILSTDHRLFTAFHPQTDGQTERQNATLEQYLRIYVNYLQNNWADLLPLAEYVYNASPHAITGVSPFFAHTGRDLIPFELHPYQGSPKSISAIEMSEEILFMQKELQVKLVKAQDQQANYFDKNHRQRIFSEGDLVLLKTLHLKTS